MYFGLRIRPFLRFTEAMEEGPRGCCFAVFVQQLRDKKAILERFAQKTESNFGDVYFPNLKLLNRQETDSGV